MADMDESQGADAAQAFEDLTAEVAGLRNSIEELADGIQLNPPPDYTISLGAITKGLAEISGRLAEIEQHPALRVPPAQFGEAVARAGSGAMREAANQLDQARRESERTTQALAQIIGSARTQDRQLKWVTITAAIALLLGLIVSPFLGRLLPFGLDGRLAATIMGADRWNAGAALMQAQSPEAWRTLMDAGKLSTANSDALGACREAAVKAKKEKQCTVVVPAP
jgi:Family of unknown function (DUF6118)